MLALWEDGARGGFEPSPREFSIAEKQGPDGSENDQKIAISISYAESGVPEHSQNFPKIAGMTHQEFTRHFALLGAGGESLMATYLSLVVTRTILSLSRAGPGLFMR